MIQGTCCPVNRQFRLRGDADLTKTALNLKEEKATRKPKITLNRESQSKQSSIVLVQPVNQGVRAIVERITGSADQRIRGTTADRHAISEGDGDQSRYNQVYLGLSVGWQPDCLLYPITSSTTRLRRGNDCETTAERLQKMQREGTDREMGGRACPERL